MYGFSFERWSYDKYFSFYWESFDSNFERNAKVDFLVVVFTVKQNHSVVIEI